MRTSASETHKGTLWEKPSKFSLDGVKSPDDLPSAVGLLVIAKFL